MKRQLTLEQILKHTRELRAEYGGSECVDVTDCYDWLASTCATQLSGFKHTMSDHERFCDTEGPSAYSHVEEDYARWTAAVEESAKGSQRGQRDYLGNPGSDLVTLDAAVEALEEMIEKKK